MEELKKLIDAYEKDIISANEFWYSVSVLSTKMCCYVKWNKEPVMGPSLPPPLLDEVHKVMKELRKIKSDFAKRNGLYY
jgi:hypothetical protein